MSNAETQLRTPDQVASLEETRALVRSNLRDVVGGTPWLIGFVVLIGLFVVIDTFALPFLMGLRDPAREFLDICQQPGGGAGGFAILLLGCVVLCLAGLAVIAPRSIMPSWAFLIVLFGLQIYVGYNDTLIGAIQNSVLSRIYDAGMQCNFATGAISGFFWNPVDVDYNIAWWFQSRYNPVALDGSGGANVPPSFTTMLVFNLLLAALFASVIWLIALFSLLLRAVMRLIGRKPPQTKGDPAHIKGWFALRGAERTIVVQAAAMTLVLAMIGPLIVLYSNGPQILSKPVEDLLWIGPFIFLLDLARLALWSENEATSTSDTQQQQDVQKPLVLQPVMRDLSRKFKNRIAFEKTVPADTEVKAALRERSARRNASVGMRLARPQQYPSPGHTHIYLETLTPRHNEIFTDILNRSVLDQGRTALIICPLEALDDVQAAYTQLLDRRPGRLLPNWFRLGDEPANADVTFDAILASPETLEELIHDADKYQTELTLLGGIFILNLNRMDLGLLHVSLRRLEKYVGRRNEMVAIVQTEFRNNIENRIKNLPLLPDVETRPVQGEKQDRAAEQHIIVATPEPTEAFIDPLNWPMSVQAMIAARASNNDVDPYLFDVAARHVSGTWDKWVVGSLATDDHDGRAKWARGLKHPVLAPLAIDHPVAVIEDRTNLADTVNISVATDSSDEALKLIVGGYYPCAPFLMEAFRAALNSVSSDNKSYREALRQFSIAYSSMTPQPDGGPLELALMIQQEFRAIAQARSRSDPSTLNSTSAMILSQARVDELMNRDSGTALRQLRIFNTRQGLDRLFRIALRGQFGSSLVSKTAAADRSWNYMLTDSQALASEAIVGLRLVTAEPRPEVVPLSDHGLSYAEGVRIIVAGRQYEINSIDPHGRKMRLRADEERPYRPVQFVRDYALLGAEGTFPDFAAELHTSVQPTRTVFEIAVGYLQAARRTVGVQEFAGLNTPFADGKTPVFSALKIDDPLSLRSAAVVRFFTPEAMRAKKAGAHRSSGRFGRRRSDDAAKPGQTTAAPQSPANGVIAFTLATTLQDLLGTLFPAMAHRIAVLSPQAEYAPQGSSQPSPVQQFALRRQPWLNELALDNITVAARTTGLPQPLTAKIRARYAELFDAFVSLARETAGGTDVLADPTLSLLILEDCDHDLGIAKAFQKEYQAILPIWRDFLSHCVGTQGDPAGFAYGFQSGVSPECFDFQGALDVVRGMSEQQ